MFSWDFNCFGPCEALGAVGAERLAAAALGPAGQGEVGGERLDPRGGARRHPRALNIRDILLD